MTREQVVPGVEHRARTKFGACCGCCRVFVDYFGTQPHWQNRPRLETIGQGWIVNGDCKIVDYPELGDNRQRLSFTGPDCMLIRDTRISDFSTNIVFPYVPGGFTPGGDAVYNFYPEKEYRVFFNWIDTDNFDFISYWDWDVDFPVRPYTLAKIGSRVNGVENFFMPPEEHFTVPPANDPGYTLRNSFKKFCYVDGVLFFNTSNSPAGGAENTGASFTYRKEQVSTLVGFGTGPGFVGSIIGEYGESHTFILTKTNPEEQATGGREVDDCKHCSRPNSGCDGYVIPRYIIAEKFDDSGVSQMVIYARPSQDFGTGDQNYSGVKEAPNPTFDRISLLIDRESVSTAGTVRLKFSTNTAGPFSSQHQIYSLPATAPRDDCEQWDRLRLNPATDYDAWPPLTDTGGFYIDSDGYWEIIGVYE